MPYGLVLRLLSVGAQHFRRGGATLVRFSDLPGGIEWYRDDERTEQIGRDGQVVRTPHPSRPRPQLLRATLPMVAAGPSGTPRSSGYFGEGQKPPGGRRRRETADRPY